MVVVSQAVAAAVLGVVVVAAGGWSQAGPRLGFAVAAGAAGPVATPSFYQASALGPMGSSPRSDRRASWCRCASDSWPGNGREERLRGVRAAGAGLALVGTVLPATG